MAAVLIAHSKIAGLHGMQQDVCSGNKFGCVQGSENSWC